MLYSKFSNERDPLYALRTDILAGPDGKRYVRKTACSSRGNAHIDGIARHGRALEKQFSSTRILVNRVLDREPGPSDGGTLTESGREKGCAQVCFEYLEADHTLAQELSALWSAGEKEKAAQRIRTLTALLRRLADREFAVTADFAKLFGGSALPGEFKSMPVTDLDMVAENLLVSASGEEWHLIDYEWTYDFPIPVDFVIFRIWHYFLSSAAREEITDDWLRSDGITRDMQEAFLEMEAHYQAFLKGEHVPLREMYHDISPGLRDIRAELMLDPKDVSMAEGTVSWPKEDGEARQSVFMRLEKGGSFEVRLSFREGPVPEKVRWDPLEGRLSRFRISRIEADTLVEAIPVNGFRENGWDTFWTMDQVYELRGRFEKDRTYIIRGEWAVIDMASSLGAFTQTRLERDAYFAEMQNLRAQVQAIHHTKAYKGIEVLRRIRNFIMARVRGTRLFRDRNAGSKRYQVWFAEHRPEASVLENERIVSIPGGVKFSILVPAYRTPPRYLREMIDSVRDQTYPNWELCLADASVDENGERSEEVKAILEEYAAKDERIRYTLLDKNGGISRNTNAAAALAGGDYIGLLDHDDILAPDALFEMACAIGKTGARVLYSDEDKVSMDNVDHFDPNLKPDFSPDLLRSHNYITHFLVIERALFEKTGMFRPEFDGAQDYDLVLRCTEEALKTEPSEQKAVVHVPHLLYFWRMHPGSTAENPKSKMYAYEAGRRALEEHLKRIGRSGSVEIADLWGMYRIRYDTPGDPLVSVLIPN